ncbi:2'-5' RNA ligase family protein [Dyella japonica]|uniref:2'-5' RNA ligase n=1 Tax=Dyella japonica TaxID=231455 RepID=A0ABV2JRC0_9GAMM
MLFSDPIAGPAETLVADLRDYPEWHRGRHRYGVWVAPIDDPVLLDYIGVVRSQLADLIHPSPRRQPHLTIFVCGFHGAGEWDDDFPLHRLDRQMALLQARAEAACALPLARLDSFASAAFIPVGDPMGRLARWRQALGEGSREIRQAPYVAHITLGLYRQCVPAQVIRQRLGEVAPPPSALNVTELQYVTYDARDQFGSLDCLRRVALEPASVTVDSAR